MFVCLHMFFEVPTRNMGIETNPKVLHIIVGIQTPKDNDLNYIKDEVIARGDEGSEPPLQLLTINKNIKRYLNRNKRSIGSSNSKDQTSKNKKTPHKQSNAQEKQVEGIFHVISQASGDPLLSLNISIMHTSITSSNDIIARLADEHKLMQKLGEALQKIGPMESLSPLHSQRLKKNHD